MNNFFRFLFKHSTAVIIITLVLTVFFGLSLINLKFDPSPEKLIPENNEVTQMLEKYGTGSDAKGKFLIAIESDDIFSIEGLQTFERVILEIEQFPGITPELNPFNTFIFKKTGGRLSIEQISAEGRAPSTNEELELFKNNIIGNPFYQNIIISDDGKILCAIFSSNVPSDQVETFMDGYENLKSELEEFYTVYTTGDVPISVRSNYYMQKDLFKLFTFALLFMLACFYIGFKSKRAFLLPLSVVIIGMIWTLGFMALMGFEVNIICLTIPPLVLTIGSSYTIHILNQYYLDAEPGSEDTNWLAGVITHIGKTVFLACLTTVIGFMSLLLTSLAQTRQFGLTTSFGIAATMMLSVFYLPAVLSKLPAPSNVQHANVKSGLFTRLMGRLGLWVTRAKFFIVALFVIIIVLFFYAYPRIPAQEDYYSYFPDDDIVVTDTSYIISNVGAYQNMNITLTAPEEEANYFLQPEILLKLSEFENEMLKDPDVTSVSSIAFYIAELNNIMTGKREIPESKGLINLISRYLKMLRTSEDVNESLVQLSNEDFSRITLTFRVLNSSKNKVLSGEALRGLINKMEGGIDADFTDCNPELWSVDMRFLYLSDLLKNDQMKSTLFAIGLVFIVALIAFRGVKYGLLTLIPLVAGLMLNFIFMAFMKIPLDMITLMVTSIVIGVGVDDTIHYNIRFRKNYIKSNDVIAAIKNTHIEAGRPIMHTTISIVGGLLFMLLSNFLGIAYFGLLVCITLMFTMIGTLVLLPAVLCFVFKKPNKLTQPKRKKISAQS